MSYLWIWRPHFNVEDDSGKPETWESYPGVKVMYTIVATTDPRPVMRGGMKAFKWTSDAKDATVRYDAKEQPMLRYDHDQLVCTLDGEK